MLTKEIFYTYFFFFLTSIRLCMPLLSSLQSHCKSPLYSVPCIKTGIRWSWRLLYLVDL